MLKRFLWTWGSLQSITAWQRGFQVTALVAALVAAGFQIAAWVFGRQREILTEARDRERGETTERVRREAAARHDSELAQANAKIRALEKEVAPRTIGLKEQHDIVHALIPYEGHRIFITKLGDFEAAQYADQIIGVFRGAGWEIQEQDIGVISPPPYGVQCTVSREPDAAVKATLTAFDKAGIGLDIRRSGAPGELIIMRVGLKPVPGAASHQ